MALQLAQGCQGRFQARQQILRANPTEVVCTRRTQKVQANVGRGGSVCQHVKRRDLQVVGRQVVVIRRDADLKKTPCVARNAQEVGLLVWR